MGKYTSNGGANGELITEESGAAFTASTIVPQFDFSVTPYLSFKVWVNKPVTASVELRNSGWYPSFRTKTRSVTTINQWVTVEFNCSDLVPGNDPGWGTYDRVGVLFDKDLTGGTIANDVYYFDDIKLSSTTLTTGLSAETAAKFVVCPNPATNYILTPNAQKVTITDLNGRILKEAFNAEKVDVHSLANGVYIVKATVDNVTKVGKLIKE
ncbi:MAG TPA: T9SS type A sorting domain-containing protein [Paludibacter sp.]|nr:T9SS type A sorting domain-containing protein [Paludibacter sp.]